LIGLDIGQQGLTVREGAGAAEATIDGRSADSGEPQVRQSFGGPPCGDRKTTNLPAIVSPVFWEASANMSAARELASASTMPLLPQ